MTIQEAIRILETKKKQPFTDYYVGEAYQMAINALKREMEKQKKEDEVQN